MLRSSWSTLCHIDPGRLGTSVPDSIGPWSKVAANYPESPHLLWVPAARAVGAAEAAPASSGALESVEAPPAELLLVRNMQTTVLLEIMWGLRYNIYIYIYILLFFCFFYFSLSFWIHSSILGEAAKPAAADYQGPWGLLRSGPL